MRRIRLSFGFCALVCILAWLDWRFCLRFWVCSLFHELGHLAAMGLSHVPVESMTLSAAGAVIQAEFSDYKKELFCAAAGPLAGVVFAAALLRVFPQTALISILLSVGNLLPLYPLDGGRILRALLCLFMEEHRAYRALHIVSVSCCCVLMLLACWGTVFLQMGLWPIFAALVLLWRTGAGE